MERPSGQKDVESPPRSPVMATPLLFEDPFASTTAPLLPSLSFSPSNPTRESFAGSINSRTSFLQALDNMAAPRGSFGSTPGSNKAGSTYYFDQSLDRNAPPASRGQQSYYSGSPLADVAAQHSATTPLAGSHAYGDVNEKRTKSGGGFWGWCKRKPWLAALLAILLIALIGGIGGGVAAGLNSNSKKEQSGGSPSTSNGTGSGSGTGNANGASTDSGSGSTPPANTPVVIEDLPAWNWTDPKQKVMGVSLGNYLAIERWLDEDWFRSVAGDNSWDEWDLSRRLGPERTVEVLQEHQRNFIQESDFDELAEYGLNTIRVPLPYWALIPTQGNEPYQNASQLDRLSDVMEWSYKRKMHVVIDLHSMPGSQSGDQASGHNTSNPTFWTANNQARSIQTVQALIDFIDRHPYKTVISAVCPVNEPKPQIGFSANDPEKLAILRTFYDRSYELLSRAKIPMVFHQTFFVGNALDYWSDFVLGKDPNLLIYSLHPYPGFFPSNSDVDDMTSKVCRYAQNSIGYPVPILYGEWSAISGILTTSYMRQWYTTQLSAYSWSAGSIFWTYKAVVTQDPVLANTGVQETMFSFVDLMRMGVVPKPAQPLSMTPTDYAVYDFVNGLDGAACGSIPTSQIGWRNPAAYGNAYSGRRRRHEERAKQPSWRRTSASAQA